MPLSKTLNPLSSTGSTDKNSPNMTEEMFNGM